MAKQNLFIGSLAYATTDDSLKAFFETVGPVSSARVITDRDSGRSKGFGFVEMGSDAEAQAAINGMNGQPLSGRSVVVVNEARPMEPRSSNGGGGFRDSYGSGRRSY